MRHIHITTAGIPKPAPEFDTLPAHPTKANARMLPEDGRFLIDGEEWHVHNAGAITLAADRHGPCCFFDVRGQVMVCPPPSSRGTFAVNMEPESVITETDARPIVVTPFGVARGGSA